MNKMIKMKIVMNLSTMNMMALITKEVKLNKSSKNKKRKKNHTTMRMLTVKVMAHLKINRSRLRSQWTYGKLVGKFLLPNKISLLLTSNNLSLALIKTNKTKTTIAKPQKKRKILKTIRMQCLTKKFNKPLLRTWIKAISTTHNNIIINLLMSRLNSKTLQSHHLQARSRKTMMSQKTKQCFSNSLTKKSRADPWCLGAEASTKCTIKPLNKIRIYSNSLLIINSNSLMTKTRQIKKALNWLKARMSPLNLYNSKEEKIRLRTPSKMMKMKKALCKLKPTITKAKFNWCWMLMSKTHFCKWTRL